MSFKTLSFKTDWGMFSLEERLKIVTAQAEITRSYERWANPDYYRKSVWSYIADGLAADAKAAREKGYSKTGVIVGEDL